MFRPLVCFSLCFLAPLISQEEQATPVPVIPEGTPPPTRVMEQATIFARQATEAMRVSDWEKAAHAWQELLKLQPESAAALANLGSVEIKLDQPVAARAHLEKAVALRPNLSATWMTLGLLHIDQKNPMLGISCLTRAIHEDPSDPRLHNGLAIALKQVGWMGAAEQELQKAIDLNSDYIEAHFNLALLYLDQKPPAVESARRHYFFARDLGSPPDELVDKQLKEAGIEYQPPPPRPKTDPKEPKPAVDAEAKPKAEIKSEPKPKTVPKTKSPTPKSRKSS